MHLGLGGIQTLTVVLARTLAKFNTDELILSGVERLNGQVAVELASFPGNLRLSGLQRLDADAATILVEHKNERREIRSTAFHPDETQTVYIERFVLNSVQEINGSVAAALTRWEGNELMLNGLLTLDEESARTLAQWDGTTLRLKGLESLQAAAATELVRFGGEVRVPEEIEEVLRNTDGEGDAALD